MNENLNGGRPVQKVIYTGHKAENVKEFTSGKTILGSTSVEVSDKLVTIVQEQIPSSLNSKQRSWSPSCVAATTENHDLNIEEGNVSMCQEALLSKLGTVKSSSEVGDLLLPDHLQENHPVSPIKIEISQPPTEKLVEQQFSNEKPERATPSAGRPVVSSVGPMTREVRLFGTNLIAAIPDAIEVEKRQGKRPLEVGEPSTQAQLPDFALPPVVDGNQINTSPGKETIGAQDVIDASPQGSTEVVPTFDVHDRKEAIMVQSKELVSPMLQFVQDIVAKGEGEDVKQVQINDCKPSEKETFISSREEIMVSDATARCLTDGDVVSAPDHREIVQTEVHVQTDHGIEGTFQTGLSPSFKEVHAHSPPGKSLLRAVGAAQLPQPRLGTGGSSASHPSGGNIWRRDSGAASNPSSLANTNQAAQRSTRGSVTVIKSSSLPTAPRSVVAPGSAAYVRKRKNTLVRFPAPPITGLPSTSVHVNVPSGPSRSTPMDIKDSAFTAFDPLSRSHVSRSSQLSDSTVNNSTGKMTTFHDTSRTGEHDIARLTHPVSSSSQNTQVWPALVDQSRSLPPISQSAVSGSEHLAAEILQDIARHTHTTKDTATVASNPLDTSTIRPSSSATGNLPSGSRLYMRRKANQLVAAPLVQSSVVVTPPVPHSSDFTLGWPPVDVYVKRKTNQLVRNNIGKEIIDRTGLQDGSVGRFADGLAEGSRQRRWQFQIQKTKLGRVLSQKKRPARGSSWVWTLGGESKVPAAVMSARGSSVSPALFPWKRTGTLTPRLRRRRSLPEAKKGSLLFHLGKKLQGFRSAQPVYTRSADGFSLHRSGVVSQHGANLKWTKSLENRSKLASEAATKAVAEAEKKKRQRKEAVVVATTAAVKAKADKRAARKGERIVWVGLVAYKMDSSRHTLQRLPDLQGPAGNGGTSALPGGLDTSALLTPKRSQIGGAVYVRVGSGNQLVRDPKTATRAFASEKVRWSLHNARFRRAKKQTFCQFYTRFGKCNKGDGKCPFIHDPDKVAVCTKFLKGSCDDSTCLLTHKVIPERMPDCSYFLEGLCTNESCPYRHVNVNPKAAVCEGFLRGYCVDGDLCNKKHTYVCPVYAETGKCPLIGTCKLHHPKKKEQHIAPTKDQKLTGKRKRRYFVTENPIGDQIQRDSSSKELVEPSDEIAEFISLNDVGAETISNTVQDPERFRWQKKRLQLTSLLKHGEAVSGLETQLKPSFLLQKDKES
ncbi:unnamed protein product [Sphagnum jensenii]|uniref:C3H1-type domain-containing protein n=1 Tax=Sphagnum jensenii TaxID=128206 RepID=A0ABP0VQ12_9BRYO